MASIRKETVIDAPVEDVWDALRDFGAVHERLVPGFVVDARLDGDDRIVTFFNGAVVRELLVDLDDQARRLVWSLREGPYSHHSASAQVFPVEVGRTRFVWIADILPHELAGTTDDLMGRGTSVLKKTLEAQAAARSYELAIVVSPTSAIAGPRCSSSSADACRPSSTSVPGKGGRPSSTALRSAWRRLSSPGGSPRSAPRPRSATADVRFARARVRIPARPVHPPPARGAGALDAPAR